MTSPYRPPEDLRTPRLRLRPSAVADADAIFDAYAADPEVTRYLSWRPHRSSAETAGFLAWCDRARAAGAMVPYVIEDGTDGTILGMIEVRLQGHAVEFAYVLRRDFWGRGLMTEALGTLSDHALADPAIWRTYALCDTENPASARVMEKAGMVREGIRRRHAVYPNLSPEPRDGLVLARVR